MYFIIVLAFFSIAHPMEDAENSSALTCEKLHADNKIFCCTSLSELLSHNCNCHNAVAGNTLKKRLDGKYNCTICVKQPVFEGQRADDHIQKVHKIFQCGNKDCLFNTLPTTYTVLTQHRKPKNSKKITHFRCPVSKECRRFVCMHPQCRGLVFLTERCFSNHNSSVHGLSKSQKISKTGLKRSFDDILL